MKDRHPLSDKTVKILSGSFKGEDYWVEDWLVNLLGVAFPSAKIGNPSCLEYLTRAKQDEIPMNDGEVVGGKINGITHIVHVSELGEVVQEGRKF